MTIRILVWQRDDRWCADGGEFGGITGCRKREIAIDVVQRQALERLRDRVGLIPMEIKFQVLEGRPA